MKGKTRPVIEYDKADVDRLKAELTKQRRRSKKPEPLTPALPRVTFGLLPAEYAELAEAAQKVGMTPGEYTRRLAREALESRYLAEAKEMRAEVAQSKAQMRKMHKEFSAAFEAVLEYAGLSSTDAKKWVDDNLR